jgi:hypothetical protein
MARYDLGRSRACHLRNRRLEAVPCTGEAEARVPSNRIRERPVLHERCAHALHVRIEIEHPAGPAHDGLDLLRLDTNRLQAEFRPFCVVRDANPLSTGPGAQSAFVTPGSRPFDARDRMPRKLDERCLEIERRAVREAQ